MPPRARQRARARMVVVVIRSRPVTRSLACPARLSWPFRRTFKSTTRLGVRGVGTAAATFASHEQFRPRYSVEDLLSECRLPRARALVGLAWLGHEDQPLAGPVAGHLLAIVALPRQAPRHHMRLDYRTEDGAGREPAPDRPKLHCAQQQQERRSSTVEEQMRGSEALLQLLGRSFELRRAYSDRPPTGAR